MTLPSEKPATDVAAQCFLNALIRETTDWKLTEYPPDELLIPLDEQKSLHFRVAYFSPTQHHRFAFPARLVTASGSYPVDFTTLSRLIIDKLRHQLFLPVPLCETFHQRVLESHVHTQQATLRLSLMNRLTGGRLNATCLIWHPTSHCGGFRWIKRKSPVKVCISTFNSG